MSKKVIIIGGGIIGLCSAYYLQKEGHQVTIIDQSNMDGGASYVNAGYLSPSHIVPLSAPGVMKKGLKWMLNSASPLYIKPRLDSDFLKWTLAFNKSCNTNHVTKAIPAIKDISLMSQDLYDDIKRDESFTFHYEKKGLLMLCQTEKMLEEEVETARLAKREGLDAEEISVKELEVLEPNVNLNVKGATFYKINRGGDITYHGPGQIVGYPILDLENFFTDIHKYLRFLEEAIILTLAEYGIPATRSDGETGVWLGVGTPFPRKICAMGVRASRWVTMHGFALNVNADLGYFDNIIPCGIKGKAVTSLNVELGVEKVNEQEVKELSLIHI